MPSKFSSRSFIVTQASGRSAAGLGSGSAHGIRHDLGEVALLLEPLAPVGGALLGEQHVHQRIGLVARVERQLHQAARARVHRGLAQLARVHLAEALEAHDLRLGARLARELLEDLVALGLVERIGHLLAGVDAEQRRHRDEHVALRDQRAEVPQEQRAQQGRDVLPVGVGVGEDADLVVAQPGDVRSRPDRRRARR
jgi:hypothetical protein